MNSDKSPTDNPESDEPVDLEEFARANRPVPLSRSYRIRIDKEKYIVTKPANAKPLITGREILALAHKTPEDYLLHQRLRGGQTRTVEADERVDLSGEGPERFMTMKREAQEGFSDSRRLIRLPAADERFLNETFPGWEAISEGGSQWILIRDFPLPVGFSVTMAEVAIQFAGGYPDAPLDMAYFFPSIQRTGGQAIPATQSHALDGRQWQRWSRHRTAANPWVPGEDNIATHVAYISSFLADEFRKRP